MRRAAAGGAVQMAVGGPVSGLGAAGGRAAAAAAAAVAGGAGGEGEGDAAGRKHPLCACSSYSATERKSKQIKREPTYGQMCIKIQKKQRM